MAEIVFYCILSEIMVYLSIMSVKSKTAKLIRQQIEAMPAGEPFTTAVFLNAGSRAAVDQTLSRLVKEGLIERILRGVYVRPEYNRFVGKVLPEPLKVAKAIGEATGATVEVHGAEAARQFGLTTQMPAQAVYNTSGASKRIKMGDTEVRLRHVSPRKLALAGRPAGIALAALWYLGKESVTPKVIEQIHSKLPKNEFNVLKSSTNLMPGWLSDTFYRMENIHQNG